MATPELSILRIGELARLTSLSPDTLRHYERLGLVSASRTQGRFREYRPDAVRRVRVVQAALAIGFSLSELSELFAERAAGRAPCRRAHTLATTKLADLTARIDELSQLRARLVRTLAAWDDRLSGTPTGTPARLLDSLADDPPAAPRRKPALRSASRRSRQ